MVEEIDVLETVGSDHYDQFVKDHASLNVAYISGRMTEWIEKYAERYMGVRPSGDPNPSG